MKKEKINYFQHYNVKDSNNKNNNTSNSSCSSTKNYINIINEDNNKNNINESHWTMKKNNKLISHCGSLNSEMIEHLTKYKVIHLLKLKGYNHWLDVINEILDNPKEQFDTFIPNISKNIKYKNCNNDGEKLESIISNYIEIGFVDIFNRRKSGNQFKERFLRKNKFKHSKGVKTLIKFKDYNYELLNGGPVVPNKASVIANCSINTLSFIDYIDKHLCENANIPPINAGIVISHYDLSLNH
ncbi:hypothetical protein U3516DRAFT_747802 [Neocallimastix sp. 'constans']